MAVYLVRHAHAGDRRTWALPDDERPLTQAGVAQAEWVADHLAGAGITAVLSSPAVRCLQTVAPLAGRLGVAVLPEAGLAEEADDDAVTDLLARVVGADGASVVLCTHGNIIPVVLDHVRRGGAAFARPPHDWKKGSIWELGVDAGRVTEARYHPPPRS